MKPLRRRLATLCAAFVIGVGSILAPAHVARAADTNEVDRPYDARLDLYPAPSTALITNSSAMPVWVIYVLIGAVGIGVLFWDPRRKNLE